jgi:hypothetical protein
MTRNDVDALDRYLAGDLPLEALPERERLEEIRLREALDTVREDVRAPASFRADVMRAVAAEPTPLSKRLADWWLQPQPLRIRPAVGALALAASVALVLVLRPGAAPTGQPVAVDAPPQVVTRFVLVAPEASSVHLTGDFVSWSPDGIALEDPRGTGIWTTDVTLPPGVYQYTFVVNGSEWVPDPRAVSQVDDGFGQLNSVVIVPAEGEA